MTLSQIRELNRLFSDGVMFPKCGHMICREHLHDLHEQCPVCRGAFVPHRVIPFTVMVRSPLIDEKHKKSLWAKDGANLMVMDGHTIVERMGSGSKCNSNAQGTRRVIWKKVTRAKGKWMEEEDERRKREEEREREEEEKMSAADARRAKLEKMQRKFDWNTFNVDLPFTAEFEDDAARGYGVDDQYRGWDFFPSTKTKMILQKIQWVRRHRPNDKIILFSQFVQALRILERVLDKHGLKHLVYEGSMTRNQRKETVQQFKDDVERNEYPVMLMSLKCAALGLNLTVANHVIFMDLWWNPAVELQAIDRVHRIGQEKHVYVTRMVIKDSVEERILALQNEKQKIADSALDGANFLKKKRLTLEELAKLFGSEPKPKRAPRGLLHNEDDHHRGSRHRSASTQRARR